MRSDCSPKYFKCFRSTYRSKFVNTSSIEASLVSCVAACVGIRIIQKGRTIDFCK